MEGTVGEGKEEERRGREEKGPASFRKFLDPPLIMPLAAYCWRRIIHNHKLSCLLFILLTPPPSPSSPSTVFSTSKSLLQAGNVQYAYVYVAAASHDHTYKIYTFFVFSRYAF